MNILYTLLATVNKLNIQSDEILPEKNSVNYAFLGQKKTHF
jgi:hypothetical protein